MRNIIKEIESTRSEIINELVGSGFTREADKIGPVRLSKNDITVVIPDYTEMDDEIMFKRTVGSQNKVMYRSYGQILKEYHHDGNYLTEVIGMLK